MTLESRTRFTLCMFFLNPSDTATLYYKVAILLRFVKRSPQGQETRKAHHGPPEGVQSRH